eukprot:320717_1
MSLIGRSLNGHYTDYSNEEEEKREILITPNDTSSQCIERKLMEYILREIELITTVIRQHLARSQHKTRPIATANLLKHLTHTRRSLSLSSLSRYECIYPFCLVIKQNESPSSITAVSIHCITNILNDSLFLNTNTPQIQQCVQCIGHAICGVTLDVEQKEFDEGLLLKFMNLISCLLHHSCFIFLSESMICNIFDKLLYIYWNVNADHHSQALFAFAEISINLLIQKVFQTLPSLMHPTKQTNNVKTVHVKKTTATGYVSLKDKILQKTQAQDTNPPLEAPFNIGCLVRILSALCSGDPCSYVEGETPQMDYNELNENRLILCLNLILIALRERRVFSKGKNIDRDEILRVIDCTDIVDQIVDILFYCSSLSDVRIGYYLGSQHILNCAVLDRYIARRYSLVGLSLDCAMRLFFEDFRLPVETQQVDRIVDSFASKYCLDNDSIWCLSASATYTLCFALMMLHTNQHNQSIAHDKHMKLEEFVNLVRTVKDAADIECQLLEQLYLSITRNEIRLKHDTQSNNLSKLNWNLWIRRADNESYIQHTMCNANPQILNIIFAPLSTTFALILDSLNQITTAIDKDALVTIICDGFYHLALFISNTSSATCCMDELMLCLSRISDILKPLSYSKSYAKKEILHLLFSILYSFGANCLTAAGWNHIIQIIMQCAQTNLLPVTMCQLDDFVGGDLAGRPSNRSFKYLCQMKKKHNTKRKTETNATEGTLFGTISAFIDYLNISVDDDETLQSQKDAKSIRSAQIVLSEFCRIHFVIKKSAQFEIESVRCLMTALINNSSFGILNKSDFAAIKMMSYAEGNVYKEGDEYILQRSCLCVQFLTSVLLHNWRRMEFIWDSIRKHLLALLDDEDRIYKTLKDTKYIELHEVMVECGVICILKICVRSLQLPCTESTQSLMPCLFELICSLSVEQFHRYPSVSYQITAAIHRFIKQIYDKKKQYFRSLTTESISAADPIHRVRNAKQLSNYKWWCVTPFDHIFALIKTALHRQYLYDVCVTIFLHILGLNEDKLLFLDSNCSSMELCQLMDSACELLRVFIDQSSADDRVMTMLIAAIRNVCTQMQYFYAELKIKDNGKDEPGKTNKKQRCFEYIVQLLNYLIALCGNGSRSNQALRAVEYVLFLDSNDDFMDSKTILNMICTQLIMIQLASPAITSKARVCGIRLLNKYFVTHLEQLQPIGKEIVMKILCCCDVMVEIGRKYHKKCDLNQLYSNIKQNLKNVLIVLIDKSILKMNINPNDNDDDISISTWHKINDMFPTIKSELSAQCKHQQRDQNHIHPTPTPYDHDLLLQQDLVLID